VRQETEGLAPRKLGSTSTPLKAAVAGLAPGSTTTQLSMLERPLQGVEANGITRLASGETATKRSLLAAVPAMISSAAEHGRHAVASARCLFHLCIGVRRSTTSHPKHHCCSSSRYEPPGVVPKPSPLASCCRSIHSWPRSPCSCAIPTLRCRGRCPVRCQPNPR